MKDLGRHRMGNRQDKVARAMAKGRREAREDNVFLTFVAIARRVITAIYEHQVGSDGKPVPFGPGFLHRYDEAVQKIQ